MLGRGDGELAPPPYVRPWAAAEGLASDTRALLLLVTLQRSSALPTRRRAGPRRATVEVLAKVRALLAKAESTNFVAEAEAFTAKAQELMSRHAIDEAMVAALADLGDPARDAAVGRVLLDDPYLKQKAQLLHVIAQANGARSVLHVDVGLATVVGAAADLDMVELLFTSLLVQANVAMDEAGRRHADDRTRRFRTSFLGAFAERIGERLEEARSSATVEGGRTYGSALVPVLADKAARLDALVDEMFPKLETRRPSSTLDWRGWDAGRRAADQADTGPNGRLAG